LAISLAKAKESCIANPQKVEKIIENVTKISWQPCQTKELADSSANVGFLD
jgi:hypothetical protein